MRAFIDLHNHIRHNSSYIGEVAEFIGCEYFLETIEEVSKNPEMLAKMTLFMLKNMALDPKAGTTVAEFIDASEETVSVGLSFFNYVNMTGGFSLPRTSPFVLELVQAIEDNLNSQFFKAAAVTYRLRSNQARRNYRQRTLAARAFDECVQSFFQQGSAHKHQLTDEEKRSRIAIPDAVITEAIALRASLESRCRDTAAKRIHVVESLSCSELFQGGYHNTLAVIATRFLVPHGELEMTFA